MGFEYGYSVARPEALVSWEAQFGDFANGAQINMTVAIPTTPASYFHLLRWQGLSDRHKPLIVFTPKSMLRLKAATSAVSEFTTGSFRPLIGSANAGGDAGVRRVLLCTGKVYYDLDARRRETGATDVAIARVERLYPLPMSELAA